MKVAFIGLGDIGEPMASHLARDPFDLVVWNRTASKAEEFARTHKARVAGTPAEAVRDADVVITCLPSSIEVEAVLHGENGMLGALRKGAVLVDCTSGDPPTSRSIAAELGGRGVDFIDAPVSGGTTAAKSGTLTVMWGGEITVFERVRPVIEAFGKKIVHAGAVGAGDAIKAAGAFTIEAFDLDVPEHPLVGTWKFSVEQARESWYGKAMLYEYVLTCPWQAGPTHAKLTVKVTFTDALTGLTLTAKQDVTIKLPAK